MIKTTFINSATAQYSDKEISFLQDVFLEKGYIADSAGVKTFDIQQNSPIARNVLVKAGKVLVPFTKGGFSWKVIVENTADYVLNIPSSAGGFYDTIIVKVDQVTDPNLFKTNIATIETVRFNTATPTDNDIQTAIGSSYGFLKLGVVDALTGTTSIATAQITNTATQVAINSSISIQNIINSAILAVSTSLNPIGMVSPYASKTAPTNWLNCDGSAISRSTYANLFAILNPTIGTATMTIASPALVSKTAHGLLAGDRIFFTTTGALPTGVTANTLYYVISAGLTADAFQFALTAGGTAIVSTGSQSGVHTLYQSIYGNGDGTTTFNIPDMRGRAIIGIGTGTKVGTFVSRSSNVLTLSGFSDIADNELQTGTPVLYSAPSGAMTGLTHNTVYYVVRVTNSTISLATTLANANANSVITISSNGTGAQTFTISLLARKQGETGGEEKHLISLAEMASHLHVMTLQSVTGSGTNFQAWGQSNNGGNLSNNTQAAGGDTQHNNMQPFMAMNYIIKAL